MVPSWGLSLSFIHSFIYLFLGYLLTFTFTFTGSKTALTGSCSDAILNAALQRIALKYSGNFSQGNTNTRMKSSGSLTSLANANKAATIPSAQSFGQDSVNSRASVTHDNQPVNANNNNNNNNNSVNRNFLNQTRSRPQSASGQQRPPNGYSSTVAVSNGHIPKRPRNPTELG